MLTRATDWFRRLNPIGGRPEGLGSITESMERVREKNTHISPFTGKREREEARFSYHSLNW